MAILNHLGRLEEFPQRIISLVPSMTESLFALGMGNQVIGVTDYCVYPQAARDLPKVGGTKNIHLDQLQGLSPDLVIANQEENARADVENIAEYSDVWLVFPKTVRQMMDDLWQLVHLFRRESALCSYRTLELAVEYAENRLNDVQPVRVFAPIWRGATLVGMDWWMTFNRDTYCSDVIRLLGGQNIFSDRERRYPLEADLGLIGAEAPGERDQRYPRVTNAEIVAAQPEIILLPDEPYEFTQEDAEFLTEACKDTP
ncbi:MAG: helical backbone metal receptor, partial [Chloroflexota bacterium]